MKIVADLHIHSHYSRATSKNLTFEHLWKWAQLKGVNLLGTGDIAHPGWLQEMRHKLEPAEDGLFRLKAEHTTGVGAEVPDSCRTDIRFMLAGEISNIYKRHGQVRKVHNVIFAPTLDAVATIQARLEKIGNIRADGRPILGLDSRDLLEIILDVDERCHLIPAHIWTPWFSMLGSKSGFDSVEECFGDLTDHIFALETGLSSDPPMNWRVSSLDGYTLVSHSDAHSPQKLAREATLYDIEPTYDALFAALQSGDPAHYKGTIEFFPEEGKYHHDGHRKCGISWDPKTTLAHAGLCAQCGKPVTVGVMHRVEMLADRDELDARPSDNRAPFHRLIPLPEVLSDLLGVGPSSKRVQRAYHHLLNELGAEVPILLTLSLAQIAAVGGDQLADGIDRMRRGVVQPVAGYDGEFGVIKLFGADAERTAALQIGLFQADRAPDPAPPSAMRPSAVLPPTISSDEEATLPPPAPDLPVVPHAASAADLSLAELLTWQQSDLFGMPRQPLLPRAIHEPASAPRDENADLGLNAEQLAAVQLLDAPLIIVAGPGTGKTRTLTHRIAHLITAHNVPPEALLAITFTNKAAAEMGDRLAALLGTSCGSRIMVRTFHALGAWLLHQHGRHLGLDETFVIYAEEERAALLAQCRPELARKDVARYLTIISAAKNRLLEPDDPDTAALAPDDADVSRIYAAYQAALQAVGAVDFDDLVLLSVKLLTDFGPVREVLHRRFRWISVDEYQDVNLAQVTLLRLLVGDGANLCAIGDPDQAIYGFRGADRRYFLAFQADFPDARLLHLNRNYRSTQLILDAATQVITQDSARVELGIWSDLLDAIKVQVFAAPTHKAEAEYVVHQIEQMVGGTSYFSLDSGRVADEGIDAATTGWAFGDFAVLYRTGAQSHALAEAFHRSGIPYQVVGQTPLHKYRETRQIVACLWLMLDPGSPVHWEWAINGDRTVVAAPTVAELTPALAAAVQHDHPLQTVLPAAQQRRVAAVVDLVLRLCRERDDLTVMQLIEVVRHGLVQACGLRHSDEQAERIEQLARRAILFRMDLAGFLETLALQGEVDDYDPRADRVTLMTLHASKGLEFPVVFIVGCEDGLLPYRRPGTAFHDAKDDAGGAAGAVAADNVDVAEERRLFYVGMTRARRQLVLTRARRRFLFGQVQENPLSPFVEDIDRALKELQSAREHTRPALPEQIQLSLF